MRLNFAVIFAVEVSSRSARGVTYVHYTDRPGQSPIRSLVVLAVLVDPRLLSAESINSF